MPVVENRMFCSVFDPVGSQHGKIDRSLVTMNRATHFVPQAHTGTCLSHILRQENVERIFELKNEVEWTGKVETMKAKTNKKSPR